MQINKGKIIELVKPHLILIALFTLITFVLTYPQIRCIKQCVNTTGDQLYYAWMLNRNVDSLLHKPLSEFFNANIFYPYKNTLAFGDHLVGETILALPILLIYDNPIFAQNVLILLSFIFTAYGMYLLSFKYFNSREAAFITAIIFTFSNVRFNQYDHLNLISTQWFPFLFLFLHRWLTERKRKDLIALGIVYLMASLFTFYYFVFASFAMTVYVICYIFFISKRGISQIREFFPLLGTIVLFSIFLIPLFIPYFQFAKEFPYVKRTIYDNVQFSATPLSFLYSAKTTLLARLTKTDTLSESEAGLFMGYIPLLFALVAFFRRNQYGKRETPIILMAIVSFLIYMALSFGPFPKVGLYNYSSVPLPYYVLYYIFPPFKFMRVPARFAIFADLFLSILAGAGFILVRAKIQNKIPALSARIKRIIVLVGCTILIVLETWSVPLDLVYIELKQDFPPVYHWLAQQPSESIIFELPVPQIKDTSVVKSLKTRHAFLTNLTQDNFETIEAYREYFSILHKKRMINGYNGYFPPLYDEVIAAVQTFPSETAIQKIKSAHIDFIIVHTKQFSQKWRDTQMGQMFNNPSLRLIKQFDDDYVYSTF